MLLRSHQQHMSRLHFKAVLLQKAYTTSTAAGQRACHPQQGPLHGDNIGWEHVLCLCHTLPTQVWHAPLLVGEAHGCAWERPGGTHCSAGLHLMGLVLPKGPIAQSENMPKLFSSVLCGRSTHTQPPDALVCLAASKGLRPSQQAAIVNLAAPEQLWEVALNVSAHCSAAAGHSCLAEALITDRARGACAAATQTTDVADRETCRIHTMHPPGALRIRTG